MKTEEVRKRVKKIEEIKDDSEEAHGSEDDLYRDVLWAISKGAKNAKALATEALKTDNIDFEHWYA